MTTETIDVESRVIEGETRAMTVSETVSLPVPIEEVLQQWRDYQELTRQLLDDSDYQQIGNKKFKKKSAWRKYARAFNITDRVTHEEIQRTPDGFPLFARLRVEARAVNGRTAEADQECHVRERCCEIGCRKVNWKGHDCCPSDCNGQRHWSHPGDLPATALTRAKNRAISDLIGAGEVSAEEMQDGKGRGFDDSGSQAVTTRVQHIKPPSCPDHGQNKMQYVPAGENAKGAYGAFWKCTDKECKRGKNNKGATGWTIFDEQWKAIQQSENNTEPAMTQDDMDVSLYE